MAEVDVEDPSSSRPQGEGSRSSRVISLVPTMDTLSDLFQAAARSMVSTFKFWTSWVCFPFHQVVWSRLSMRARAAILHGSVVGFLWFLIILALVTHCLPMQIAIYPVIACLHIWTSSGQTRTEKIVFGAFLGALALLVVDLSIISRCRLPSYYDPPNCYFFSKNQEEHSWPLQFHQKRNQEASILALWFTANTVALSSHCIWKIYPVAIRPWLHRYCLMIWELYPWLQYLRVRLGSFFFINMQKKRVLFLHASVIAILLFHIIFALATKFLPMQIAIYPAIACLHIWTSSGQTRMEKIVFGAFLGALALLVLDLSIICRCRGITTALSFTANTVALSSHCIWKLYPVAIRPWLQHYCKMIWELYLYPIARRAHPVLLGIGSFLFINMQKKKRVLFLHASVIAIILFHIILALATHCLPMQIALYPAIACLHIWASSGQTEIIVSAVFLGALVLVVVFVSIGAQGLHIGIMFMANVVAISFHCIWKLYPVAQPWLHRYWRRKLYPIAQPWLLQYLSTLAPAWLVQDEEAGRLLLLPRQQGGRAAFRMREFSYDELRTMTQDFRSMVGQGGFAQVFRGVVLDDDGTGTGTAVAVKRMITTTGGGGGDDRPPAVAGDDDFLREISIVSNVHHRSLVRLLGYCLPRERQGGGGSSRYLVYPFFDNGSLDSWLFHGTQERRRLLPWPTRRCIAVDVAKALAYLHHECWQQILHLDVKPGNILLDADLRAHLSDFGISISITRDMSSVDTRGRGTPGYMAPEMLVNAVSAKSDVFSYGMTLLELIGGRRNFDPAATDDDASSSATPDFTRDFFPYIVRDKMARGELMEAVDAAMALVDQEEVEAVVKVALCCIQSRWDMRPTMLTVVDMLEGRVAADLPLQSRRLSTVNFSDLLSSSSSSLTHGR